MFDWEEPSPIEDAVLADIEGWDLDAEGNPIDPRKKPEGMSKFQQELSAQYNYLVTTDKPTNGVNMKNKNGEPTPEQIKNYYEKGITEGLTDEQRIDLFSADQTDAYYNVMGDGEKLSDYPPNVNPYPTGDEFDPQGGDGQGNDSGMRINETGSYEEQRIGQRGVDVDEAYVNAKIEDANGLPKGSISKLGAVLDPISEGLEAGLRAVGLGSIASWWIKAEAANFLAGILRAGGGGLAQAQLGQSAALMGEKEIVSQTEENILKTAGEMFAQNMKLSPGAWLETKYAESSLGKGKTPTQQGYEAVKNALKLGK